MMELRMPPDKSIAQRAILCSLVTGGHTRVRGLLRTAGDRLALDLRSAVDAVRALGAEVREDGDGLTIRSARLAGAVAPTAPAAPDALEGPAIDCGNSGTTARLLTGILAGAGRPAELDGDASLRARPMRRVTDPLETAGARFVWRECEGHLPLRISPARLSTLRHGTSVASAQVKSALVLAAVTAGTTAEVVEPERSRDHTERMLRRMGIDVEEGAVANGWRVACAPHDRPRALETMVPGDLSAAAFFVGLTALAAAPALVLRDVGLNPTRTGFLDAAAAMGVALETTDVAEVDGEPVGTLVVGASELRPVSVGPSGMARLIDELPMLSVLAARAPGESRISGAGELRVKESDRIAALASNLRAVGVDVEERADGMLIEGTDRPLRGRVRSFGDHRIAMAFSVLAAQPGNQITVEDTDLSAVSFPDFGAALNGVLDRSFA